MTSNKKYSAISLYIVIAISSLVLLGWQFDVEIFKRILPSLVAMNPLTAVTFIIAALGLSLIHYKDKTHLRNLISFLSIIVIVVGLIMIFDYTSLYNLRLDGLLFSNKIDSEITGIPNRMAPNTAVNFIFLGLSILLLNIKRRKAFLADYLALLVALVGLTSVIGYIYKAKELYEVGNYIPMALHTAICFCMVSSGIFSYKKDRGIIKETTSRYGARQITAILFPVALIVPVVLGFLSLQFEKISYSPAFTTAMYTIANMLILLFFMWMIAVFINRLNYSLIIEIALRKKIEEDLKENNLFLDTILNNIPDNFFVKDAKELRYIRVNHAVEKLLDRKRDEIIGKSDSALFSKEEAEAFTKNDREVLRSGNMMVIPEERIKKGNTEIWVNTKKIPINGNNGEPSYLIGLARDVTEEKKQHDRIKEFSKELEKKVYERTKELRKSEQRFRTLIESGIDAIKMMDADGTIFYASDSHERIIGFTPKEMIMTQWMSYVHPDDMDTANNLLKSVHAEHSVPKPATLRLRHKLGHYVLSEGYITNLLHDENVKALICNFHDVSKREKLETEKRLLENALTEEKINRQIQIAQATIDGQEQERTEIGMELHDNICQILGAIKLYIGTAKHKPESTKKMLGRSEQDLMLCIKEVRKLSKALVSPNIEMGLNYAITDLVNVLKESTDLQIEYTEDIELIHTIPGRTQLTLYRIIQEQLNNIIKHSEAKTVTISIERSDHTLHLKIADNGIGFNPTITHTGIGLSNIANRVEFLKGSLKIISSKGEGCKIIIEIPL